MLYAVNPAGSIIWEFNTGTDVSINAGHTDNGDIYIRGADGRIRIVSHTGRLRYYIESPGECGNGPFLVMPSGVMILACETGVVLCLSVEGSVLWEYEYKDGIPVKRLQQTGDGILCVYENKYAVLLDISGTQIREYLTEASGELFMTDGGLYIVEPQGLISTGRGGRTEAAPAPGKRFLSAEYLQNGIIAVSSDDWLLYAYGNPESRQEGQNPTASPDRISAGGDQCTTDSRLMYLEAMLNTGEPSLADDAVKNIKAGLADTGSMNCRSGELKLVREILRGTYGSNAAVRAECAALEGLYGDLFSSEFLLECLRAERDSEVVLRIVQALGMLRNSMNGLVFDTFYGMIRSGNCKNPDERLVRAIIVSTDSIGRYRGGLDSAAAAGFLSEIVRGNYSSATRRYAMEILRRYM